jgi:small subunit ribosomal protein S24e
MEIQIIKDKTNPILNRREISLKVKERATPSRVDVKGKLAALLNSKPELIVIEHLDTIYGKQELVGTACIYQSEERLKQLAHQHLVARDAPKVKEGAEAPAAAPAAKEPEVKAETKPEAKSEAKHEAKPKVEAKAEPKSEAKPKAEPKAEAKPKAEPKAEAKSEEKKKSEKK